MEKEKNLEESKEEKSIFDLIREDEDDEEKDD